MGYSKDQIRDLVKEQKVEFLNLQFTDIVGIIKNVTIPVTQIEDMLDHGVWFDGSSIEGYARVAESDMFLVPDLDTYAVIPWDSEPDMATARFICTTARKVVTRPSPTQSPSSPKRKKRSRIR